MPSRWIKRSVVNYGGLGELHSVGAHFESFFVWLHWIVTVGQCLNSPLGDTNPSIHLVRCIVCRLSVWCVG